MQILTPVQDPNASHTKLCAVNPYAEEAFQQCQPFLMLVHSPEASHAKSLCLYRFPTIQIIPYAGETSNSSDSSLCGCRIPMLHMQILALVQVPKNSNNCLRLCRFPKIQTIACAKAGFRQFTRKSLCLYRFPMLHTHILTLVQVPENSDDSLRLGSLPTILKIPYMTKINSV
ncbi:hypothetical protein O181_033943 [Austropuccinia psidii MF-1]|uniref:Uncharacterized protein n=1 Tax=Austropuccinia psidii MF-1 TaxID=1389203 RepID=A0A9Q3H6W8_9BASI|nr:hypothetical protein [Austropuccinia psidii MF-1]